MIHSKNCNVDYNRNQIEQCTIINVQTVDLNFVSSETLNYSPPKAACITL